MNMENIDLHDIACFGFTVPRADSWYVLLHKVASGGWKSIDTEKFEKSLAANIVSSYENLVSISFKDLDTDFEWLCGFDNKLKLWKLELPGSPDDAVDPADKKAFFKSETFKKTCKRADEILGNAYKSCMSTVMPAVEQGMFISIDDIKLEAVLHMLDDSSLRKSLKAGKYVH